ncbi:phosphotransferase [Aneurinibacillus terranovensis]|uniref:phosphotransferase n=1 Tax=Aneurinibacillus terranovensis TaxID=278991 RepID=UPI00041BEF35|nr:phosphotransferase [Aneurinibacillus terranovensis]
MERQAKHLLYEYDLRPLAIQTNEPEKAWLIKTKKAKYLLKKTEEKPAQIESVANALYFLEKQGMKSILPFCKTKYGESYIHAPKGMFTLIPWDLDGGNSLVPTNWELIVLQEMARIHAVSSDMEKKWTGYGPVALRQIGARWKEGIVRLKAFSSDKSEGQLTPFQRCVAEDLHHVLKPAVHALHKLEELERGIDEDKGLPLSLCHGNIHRKNLLFSDNRLYFLNYEKANYDTPVRDLALFFRKHLFNYSWDNSRGSRWLAIYNKHRPLSEQEKRLLGCCLLYPERMMSLIERYTRDRPPAQNVEQEFIERWQKDVKMLTKIQKFVRQLD